MRHRFFWQSHKRNENAMEKAASIWLRDESRGVIHAKIAGSKSPK
jgi:hypothetical protein